MSVRGQNAAVVGMTSAPLETFAVDEDKDGVRGLEAPVPWNKSTTSGQLLTADGRPESMWAKARKQ